ncbi:hypothetical protein F5Y19DRAFT_446341 [Xylariaceae sp. FL1651]|nr:hypothetical protein F5Y19DRAFT_446341 [Xylariaceae sp. FL1651]
MDSSLPNSNFAPVPEFHVAGLPPPFSYDVSCGNHDVHYNQSTSSTLEHCPPCPQPPHNPLVTQGWEDSSYQTFDFSSLGRTTDSSQHPPAPLPQPVLLRFPSTPENTNLQNGQARQHPSATYLTIAAPVKKKAIKPIQAKASCISCRERKVKCDKIKPCNHCKNRGIECLSRPNAKGIQIVEYLYKASDTSRDFAPKKRDPSQSSLPLKPPANSHKLDQHTLTDADNGAELDREQVAEEPQTILSPPEPTLSTPEQYLPDVQYNSLLTATKNGQAILRPSATTPALATPKEAKSCNQCRGLRVRCDRRNPCQRCQLTKVKCIYSARRKPALTMSREIGPLEFDSDILMDADGEHEWNPSEDWLYVQSFKMMTEYDGIISHKRLDKMVEGFFTKYSDVKQKRSLTVDDSTHINDAIVLIVLILGKFKDPKRVRETSGETRVQGWGHFTKARNIVDNCRSAYTFDHIRAYALSGVYVEKLGYYEDGCTYLSCANQMMRDIIRKELKLPSTLSTELQTIAELLRTCLALEGIVSIKALRDKVYAC